MCSDSASRRRTRTSERSHTATFSLSESENRGTRPRFSGICEANSIKTCAKRTKGTPKACLFCVPPGRRAPKGRYLRPTLPSARRADRRTAVRRIKFPIKVQLCRTFIPLPAPRRRGLVRRADERGVSQKVSSELFEYLGGTQSPLDSQGESEAFPFSLPCIYPILSISGYIPRQRKTTPSNRKLRCRANARCPKRSQRPVGSVQRIRSANYPS